MSWFRRRKVLVRGPALDDAVSQHLSDFVRSRRGVEAYLEPQTVMTETTILLIAHDGEWTRRRVGSPQAAHKFAHQHSIPLYDVQLVGYPQRMRDHNARRRIAERRANSER